MSTKPLLLAGNEREKPDFQTGFAQMKDEITDILSQLDGARAELREARAEADGYRQIVNNLRQVLNPLYDGLRQIYGHMDRVPYAGTEQNSASGMPDVKRQEWQQWITRLPGARANFISALLTHREMNAKQLRVVMKCRIETVYDAAKALYKLGLIEKRGTSYALRDL